MLPSINTLQIVMSLLVHLQSSENVDSNFFASTFVAFMEERIFGGPYSVVFLSSKVNM